MREGAAILPYKSWPAVTKLHEMTENPRVGRVWPKKQVSFLYWFYSFSDGVPALTVSGDIGQCEGVLGYRAAETLMTTAYMTG